MVMIYVIVPEAMTSVGFMRTLKDDEILLSVMPQERQNLLPNMCRTPGNDLTLAATEQPTSGWPSHLLLAEITVKHVNGSMPVQTVDKILPGTAVHKRLESPRCWLIRRSTCCLKIVSTFWPMRISHAAGSRL